MKAIVLSAGYATRLYPLTKDTPKGLLPIGKKSILDFITDEIETIPEIDEMFINEAGKQDGGAIQFITPFSINQLQEINLLLKLELNYER